MRLTILFALSVVSAGLASAQGVDHAPLATGSIIRLTWGESPPVRARLLAPLEPQAEVVIYCRYPTPACNQPSPHDTLRAATAGLTSLEIRQGNLARRGAVIGGLSGVATALFVLVGTAEARRAGNAGREMAWVATVGLTWAGIGALIGSGHDRWTEAP